MVTSTSRLAYGDCYDLMDKAITDPKGIQIKFAKQEDAWHFRIRLHTARKIDRIDNKVSYPETHALYGRSVYDVLTMRIRLPEGPRGLAWLRLERIDAREFEIESLSEPEVEPELSLPPAELQVPTHTTKTEYHEVKPIRSALRRL